MKLDFGQKCSSATSSAKKLKKHCSRFTRRILFRKSKNVDKSSIVEEMKCEDEAQSDISIDDTDLISGDVIRKFLARAIRENELLANFEKHQVEAMVAEMYSERVAPNTRLIQEDELGTIMYISEQGTFEVYQNAEYVRSFGPGVVFGELALLHKAKRTFSVDAAGDECKVWVLERSAFQDAMAEAAKRHKEEHVERLRGIPILDNIPDSTLEKIADLIRVDIYAANTTIVSEGQFGQKLYMIDTGNVRLTKKLSDDDEEICTLGAGSYFGEEALCRDARHEESIVVTALEPGVECFTIDKKHFNDYLGDVNLLRDDGRTRQRSERRVMSRWRSEYPDLPLSSFEAQVTLGIGSFGKVELVTSKHAPNMEFALKKIRKHDVSLHDNGKAVPNEKQIMQMCNSLFICKLYQTYNDSQCVYLLMEACLGGNLFRYIRKNGKLDNASAKFSLACIIEGLDYLHQRNIVYRDLKPENVIIDKHGYLKLTDFGSSKILGPGKTKTFVGTPEYMAPEIILNKTYDRAVDYWSLGILLYEMLMGRPPFEDTDIMRLYTRIVKGIFYEHASFEGVKSTAEDLIRKLLQPKPEERLGYLRGGIADIRTHKWLGLFNLEALRRSQLSSPVAVQMQDYRTAKYVDSDSGQEGAVQDHFADWDRDF